MVVGRDPNSEKERTYGSTPLKKCLLLILGVLGLLAVAPNESKAQGFSITFGAPEYYYGSGYYNGGYCNPGDGYYYYHRRVYYRPNYYRSYYYGNHYRRHHRWHHWHDND
jgi:hypothetical protein